MVMINKEVVDITTKYLQMTNGLSNSFEVHPNFWNVYEKNKNQFLIELFDEEMIIEKEVKIKKTNALIEDKIFEVNLINDIRGAADPAILDKVHRPYDSYAEEDIETIRLRKCFFDLTCAYSLARQVTEENYEFLSPITNKVVKIQKGSKVNKALKFFISDKEALENIQTKYSQVVNDKFIYGKLCISIHPMDYLTASVNKSSWTSCYDTIEKGCWCASTLSLLSSPNTVMVYLKTYEDADYNGVVWNNKKWRCFASIGEDCNCVHFGRNYPFESKELMEEALSMIGKLAHRSYLSISETRNQGSVVEIVTPPNMYNDADCEPLYVCAIDGYTLDETIEISTDGAVCPSCGEHYEDCEFDILCGSCGHHVHCDDCGTYVSEDEMNRLQLESGDVVSICDCCAENYYYCTECGYYHRHESVEYVVSNIYQETGWRSSFSSNDYYCHDCLDALGGYTVCHNCGEKILNSVLEKNGHECLCGANLGDEA